MSLSAAFLAFLATFGTPELEVADTPSLTTTAAAYEASSSTPTRSARPEVPPQDDDEDDDDDAMRRLIELILDIYNGF